MDNPGLRCLWLKFLNHEIPYPMTAHILGCGPSLFKFSKDLVAPGSIIIGVNDSFKLGVSMDVLLFMNWPIQFHQERMEIIKRTETSKVVTLTPMKTEWEKYFPVVEGISATVMPSKANFKLSQVYHTQNSPFCAMSYAVAVAGAHEVVLWGVDFIGHKFLRYQDCAPEYTLYSQVVRPFGISIKKGSNESPLVLEVWKSSQQ